jgi:hypothetical protein
MMLPGQALQSLRDAGFDFAAALAEVIDNSIEAKGNLIQVRLDEDKVKGKNRVVRVVITDDGTGMDEDTLHRYLQLGFSTRWMRRDTIGKYGVGAKLAALNFADRASSRAASRSPTASSASRWRSPRSSMSPSACVTSSAAWSRTADCGPRSARS